MKFEEREVNLKVHTQAHHFGMNELLVYRSNLGRIALSPVGQNLMKFGERGETL